MTNNIIYINISKIENYPFEFYVNKLLQRENLPPEPIKKNTFGRPYLTEASKQGWDISLSHSSNYFGIVMGRYTRIGIDCEEVKPINVTSYLLDLILTPKEKIYWYQSEQNLENFYEIWTKKEAISKALGIGLWLPFNQISLKNLTADLKSLSLILEGQKVICKNIFWTENLKVSLAMIFENHSFYEIHVCQN